MYIDKFDEIVNKYNNTYHRIIKIKSVDVTPSMYISSNKENSKEGPKFRVSHRWQISKYKNIFAKGYVPNWSEEVLVIKKNKNTVPCTYVINDLKCEEVAGMFYEKEFKKQIIKCWSRKSNKEKRW